MARREQSESNYTNEELAASACRVYSISLGGGIDAEHANLDGWARVAERVIDILETEPADFRWIDFAGLLFGAYHQYMAVGDEFNALPPVARAAWEAVARHLTNIIGSDDRLNVDEHEQKWHEWAIEKAKKVAGAYFRPGVMAGNTEGGDS